jgi:hypothetical protein
MSAPAITATSQGSFTFIHVGVHHPPFSPPQAITANEIQFNGSGGPANLHLRHAHRRSLDQ